MCGNPTALLLSAVLMLHHIGEAEAAARVRTSLHRALSAGSVRTRDLGGPRRREFAAEIVRLWTMRFRVEGSGYLVLVHGSD